jgi:hypothetical protein
MERAVPENQKRPSEPPPAKAVSVIIRQNAGNEQQFLQLSSSAGVLHAGGDFSCAGLFISWILLYNI